MVCIRTKAALFDAGDTLVHQWVHKGDRFCWLCEQAGLSVPQDSERRRRAAVAGERFFQTRQQRADRDTLSFWTEWATICLGELGLPAAEAVPALLKASRRLPVSQWLDPEAIPLLQALRERGWKIGLVSNWDGTLAATCDQVELTPYIDYVGDSHVYGKRKPDPSFFHHVLEQLQVGPENAIHVGDSWGADVVGAEAAGITPVLLDAMGYEDRPAAHRVTSLKEILAICEAF